MAQRKKKMMLKDVTPIPEEQRVEWNKLLTETRRIVADQDRTQWKLVFLAGQVTTKYGEDRIGRWAEECNIDRKTAYEYAMMNRMGVDEEFVKKWDGLSYSVVRAILRHTGRVASPATDYFLEYAREHNVSVRFIQAYMLDTIQPDKYKETLGEEIKMALQQKQESEGFSDYIKFELEKLAEQHPEIEEDILKTTISNVDDITHLKIKAGVMTDDEQAMVDKAKRLADRIRRDLRWLNDNKAEITQNIAYGHEFSDELKFRLTQLKGAIEILIETEMAEPLDLNPEDFDIVKNLSA